MQAFPGVAKRLYPAWTLAVCACLGGCVMIINQEQNYGERFKTQRLLRHVVMIKFKEDAPAEKIVEIEQAFAELPSKIEGIKGFEWGTDASVEGLSHGYTHCFVVTFEEKKARDEYIPNPAHREFAAQLKPFVEDVLVLDYWTN
ncbi:MAG: Stress responsive A/B Barrel Domain protein [candidate division BRC1 bacterium ADurb.BinA364]|nr:MAG: Stress responsive A/B Barrel Domain protein [candidate division BRC1 bacterium ADurb.BinA364]